MGKYFIDTPEEIKAAIERYDIFIAKLRARVAIEVKEINEKWEARKNDDAGQAER